MLDKDITDFFDEFTRVLVILDIYRINFYRQEKRKKIKVSWNIRRQTCFDSEFMPDRAKQTKT